MFSDPLAVTYDGVSKSLARVGAGSDSSVYTTADREFVILITNSQTGDGLLRREITLGRNTPDPTPDAFTGNPASVPNRFGLVYELNLNRFNASTEVPLLRTALLSLVDSSFQARLVAGEK